MDTRETITLDTRAQQRLTVLTHLLAGDVTLPQAAAYLRLSERQVRRLAAGYRRVGAAALVHGNQGRVPINRHPDELRERLVRLATTSYAGVNRAHLAELLTEREALVIPERTLRRILEANDVPPVRRRRPARHRARRERMARAGLLLQVDGSRHDWLEGRGPWLTLVGGIDDATGAVTGATFRAQEDAAGYFEVLLQTVRHHGLPVALYSDRHGIFWRSPARPPTLAEQLTGQRSLTQLGRALRDAGIGWIAARSPQAKGRVERLWGTFQDRLVSDLRLAGADTLEAANEVLARHLPRHNTRFAVPAADPQAAWRAWSLASPATAVFCFHYARRVAPDATLSWASRAFSLPRRADGASWARCGVILQERLDGSLWVSHEEHQYPLRPAPAAPVVLRARQLRREPLADLPQHRLIPAERLPSAATWKPAPDHPWRSNIKRPR